MLKLFKTGLDFMVSLDELLSKHIRKGNKMNQEGKMNKKFAQVKINLCTSTFSKNFLM